MSSHFEKVGNSLSSAVDCYNKTISSLEARVLPSARKFEELGVKTKKDKLPILNPIEKTIKQIKNDIK